MSPKIQKPDIKKKIIHRAFYISLSKTIFYKELTNIKQTLVNNYFPNKLVDQQIILYLYAFITFTKITRLPTLTAQTELIYITEIKCSITTN